MNGHVEIFAKDGLGHFDNFSALCVFVGLEFEGEDPHVDEALGHPLQDAVDVGDAVLVLSNSLLMANLVSFEPHNEPAHLERVRKKLFLGRKRY